MFLKIKKVAHKIPLPYNIKIVDNNFQLLAISLNETSTGIMCSSDKIKDIRNKF